MDNRSQGFGGGRGFTMVEMVVALAVSALLATGGIALLLELRVLPAWSTTKLGLQRELDQAAAWLRIDAATAQSFVSGASPTYGTFYWVDYSTSPATTRYVIYSWSQGALLRQAGTTAGAEGATALVNHIEDAADITFSVAETAHSVTPAYTVRTLTAAITAARDDGVRGTVTEAATVVVNLRPEVFREGAELPVFATWTGLPDAPEDVKEGGALTTDGTDVYAFSGDGKDDFWKYDVGSQAWSSLEDAPARVNKGGALAYANGHVYAFRGDDKDDFWRYDVAGDIWHSLEDAPERVEWGGSLAWDGSDTIFAFRGDDKEDFWKYSISADSWITLEDAPNDVNKGGAMVYVSGAVYALRGDDKDDFWRYDVVSDTWHSLEDAPEDVNAGGALAWDGSDAIYAFRGDDEKDFWQYSISSDAWTILQDTPGDVNSGGSMAYVAGDLYALRGDDKDAFWRY